ncbi:hypothetical protein A2U01_0042045, partial [Trifolium medium]|nr:hypothetical protein [Trifolium medium]
MGMRYFIRGLLIPKATAVRGLAPNPMGGLATNSVSGSAPNHVKGPTPNPV